MIKKYVLAGTDGYSIDMTPYDSKEEARTAMKKAYKMFTPIVNDETFKNMSEFNEDNAILYANGENVYVWNIKEVVMKKEYNNILPSDKRMEYVDNLEIEL